MQGLDKHSGPLLSCHCILWLRPLKSSFTAADKVAFQQQGEWHEIISMKLTEVQKHSNESKYFVCHSLFAQMQIKCVFQIADTLCILHPYVEVKLDHFSDSKSV